MDFNFIKRLVKLFDESSITELEVEEAGQRIKISKRQKINYGTHPQYVAVPPEHSAASIQTKSDTVVSEKDTTLAKTHEIHSPIVGTFYRAPSPEAEPYVKVGDIVSPGTILCVIEAMKLMNEIECDVAGKVVKVLIDNAKPVEYNQTLFLIEEL